MKLVITQADLDHGHALTPGRNPLTVAIHRLMGWSYHYQDGLLWPPAGSPVRVPDAVRNWMGLLLAGKANGPREFDIDLPEPEGTDQVRDDQPAQLRLCARCASRFVASATAAHCSTCAPPPQTHDCMEGDY